MAGRILIWVGGIAALGGLAGGGALGAEVPPGATVQWEIKVGPGECMLEGGITDPMPARLSLQTVVGSDAYRFALAGKDVPMWGGGEMVPISVQFHQADKSFDQQAVSVHVGAIGQAIVARGMGPELIDAFAHATSIGLAQKSKSFGPFPLSKAMGAITAFMTCERDQLVEWGADPAQFQPGGKRPVALKSRDEWLTRAQLLSLPGGAAKLDATFQLTIAPDGKVDGCKRIEAKPGDSIEKQGCAAVTGRILFTPASDPAGKPVRGAATFEVHLVSRPNMR